MRFVRTVLAIACLPATTLAQQDPPYSVGAGIAITTDYVFRGISRTRGGPALQLGVDGSYTLGPVDVFVRAWASNVDLVQNDQDSGEDINSDDEEDIEDEEDDTELDDDTDEEIDEGDDEVGDDEDIDEETDDEEVTDDVDDDGEQVELDFYAGVRGELPIGDGLDWDAGVVYYAFPWVSNSSAYDFIETFFGLSYTFFDQILEPEVGVRVYYALDYAAGSGKDIYTDGFADLSLPYDVYLDLHVGYQVAANDALFGLPDYVDWRVGLSREIASLDFSLSYVDTNLTKGQCFGGRDLCEARAVFTVSMEF